MAYPYPQPLQELIQAFSRLPGVGAKAAQRLAFHLLAEGREDARRLADALLTAVKAVHPCPVCGNYTDAARCAICEDPQRDRSLLCVVSGVADILSMERSGRYHGLYHVLGGVISPMDGIGPEQLRVADLLQRVRSGGIREVILATDPTMEGETTALYLAKKLKPLGVAVSRPAHGMPVGGSLAYTDEATLEQAFRNRRPL